MAMNKAKSTSWSPPDAGAPSLTMTMMGGWICLFSPARASQAPPTARRIGCTRTTGTGHSRMSRRKRVCTGSDGHVESRSETITTTALTSYFAPILDRTRCSVAVIAVQRVLSKIGAKYVVKAVVVIVSDRDSTCPSEPVQTRFLRDIRECPVPVVLVQPIRRAVGGACEARAGENKQIHPPIIVIVNEGAPASGGLHDVLFALFIAID